jgi:regulator of sigma E protease
MPKLVAMCFQWLPILYAILGFGILIIIHECGHFFFCKIFGVHTPTFSIGMGPTIIEKKIGDTNFRIGAIPIAGYVEIAGNEEVGQGDQLHSQDLSERSFQSKSYWKKLLIMIAGIAFNIAFAYIVFSVLFMIGAPKPNIKINKVLENSIAQKAGLQSGDILLKVDQHNIKKNPESLVTALSEIRELENKTVHFTVMRNDQETIIAVTIPHIESISKDTGRLGVEFSFQPSKERERYPFFESIKKGIAQTNTYIYLTVMGLKNMFTQRSLKGTGGPVLMISESIRQAQAGFIYLFIFLAIISINLAIINLLPLPILDGGQILFFTIEAIIGREIPTPIKNSIFIGSWMLILSLMLYLTYNDILGLIRGR